MRIRIIRNEVTDNEMKDMLLGLGSYVKLAVDIKREIVAGGGMLHADCEAVLVEDGSKQDDIWGADWLPESKEVKFEALINIRPRQKNRSMEIGNKKIREKVEYIVRRRFGNEKS